MERPLIEASKSSILEAIHFGVTGAFKIDSQNATVELLNSEPVPANINYAGEVSSYTSQMKLTTGGSLSGKVTVIIGNGVLSYTSVPCTTIIIICTGAILCL